MTTERPPFTGGDWSVVEFGPDVGNGRRLHISIWAESEEFSGLGFFAVCSSEIRPGIHKMPIEEKDANFAVMAAAPRLFDAVAALLEIVSEDDPRAVAARAVLEDVRGGCKRKPSEAFKQAAARAKLMGAGR